MTPYSEGLLRAAEEELKKVPGIRGSLNWEEETLHVLTLRFLMDGDRVQGAPLKPDTTEEGSSAGWARLLHRPSWMRDFTYYQQFVGVDFAVLVLAVERLAELRGDRWLQEPSKRGRAATASLERNGKVPSWLAESTLPIYALLRGEAPWKVYLRGELGRFIMDAGLDLPVL